MNNKQLKPIQGFFHIKKEVEMERVKGKITPEKALEMLKKEGLDITLEQAGTILEFLRKLANIAVSKYLRK